MHTTRIVCAAAVLAASGLVGCSNDNLTNLNRNPNSPTSAPPGPLFTDAARLAASRMIGNGFDLRQTEFVAQHWAEVQYPDEDRYARLDPSSTAGTWNFAYYNELEDLKKISDAGLAAKAAGMYGPAQILEQWEFEYLTDTYGDIPYSQALKGDTAGGSLTPKFDKQQDVYKGMFATLTADATALQGASNALGSADPVYGGDPAKWQRFANSLRARMAMRIVNADPAMASTELAAALAAPGGVFTSNADNATLAWPGDGVYNNPMTDNFVTRDDHRVSQTFANILVGYNDPRTPIFMQPVSDSSLYPNGYGGMPNGLTAAEAGTYAHTASRPGSFLYPGKTTYGTFGSATNKQNPSYYMTYAELLFIEAEAAQRGMGGLTPGQAQGFYNAGITASMQQWGVTDAGAIAAYLADTAVAYKGGTEGLKQIAIQKWIALVTDGAQSWAEWRRTCQPPTIKPGPAAVVPYVPRRFRYPPTEYTTNASNVAAANTDQGPDTFATRVWWDQPQNAPTCAGVNLNLP